MYLKAPELEYLIAFLKSLLPLTLYGLLCCSNLAIAEQPATSAPATTPPKLDFVGGYYKGDQYICYQEPCFSIHKGTEAAASKDGPYKPAEWNLWFDIENDCQDSRIQILASSSQIAVQHQNQDKCKEVLTGQWLDPYSGTTITEVSAIDVDHWINPQEAHRYGGAYWPRGKRAVFANDPVNLVPVSANLKKDRNGRPGSQWMPPNKEFWCDYIVHREVTAQYFKLIFPLPEQEFNQNIKNLYCKF